MNAERVPVLTVSIVSFNTVDYLRRCLKSLLTEVSSLAFEIIVVDNASQDGSADMVQREFPEVKLIRNPDNRLFTKANNQAFRSSTGEFFLLCNPDTEVTPRALEQMVEFLRAHRDAGVVGPRIVNSEGVWQPSCYRAHPWLWGLAEFSLLNVIFYRNRLFWHKHYGDRNLEAPGPHEVETVTGACLMIRRSLLERLGGMDERYEMYCEETDLCQGVRDLGYKVLYFPSITVVHHVGRATRTLSRLTSHRWLWRSNLYFYRKHASWATYALFRLLAFFTWPLFAAFWTLRRRWLHVGDAAIVKE